MTAVKIVQVLGTSDESWEDAAREAVKEATKTIDDIHGIEITDQTADVIDGEIAQYKTTVRLAFPVHPHQKEEAAGLTTRVKKSASKVRR
ncbi:dodecin family protein [Halomarina rubra]|uniref:Dodecin family protein n=1 Tax=Halomarina rubra TaxID=2071873 RepID=A0ABD6ASB4_9EURY|nr:dodecin family protein [Halomarina rubra]